MATRPALDENHGPLLPVSHYGAGKLASEAFIASFVANYGMQAWIARFANIVGERATHRRTVRLYQSAAPRPRELPVRGNGEQAKPYLYVKELVEALVFVWQNAGEPLNVFNVGVDSRTSVKQIVHIVTDEMRVDPEVHYEKAATGWVGDVAKCNIGSTNSKPWVGTRGARRTKPCDAVRAMLET